jgi:ubiquinone biosynthesis protein Coq4
MDKLAFYRQCIQQLLTEYGDVRPINDEIETQIIFDTEHDHYQIIDLGWDKHHRIYNCVMHLDIKNVAEIKLTALFTAAGVAMPQIAANKGTMHAVRENILSICHL